MYLGDPEGLEAGVLIDFVANIGEMNVPGQQCPWAVVALDLSIAFPLLSVLSMPLRTAAATA
jgi:hypothetical protein